MKNLLPATKWLSISAAVAAGTDGAYVACTEIDRRGFDGVMIVYLVGVIAASGVITTRVKNHTVTSTPGSGTVNMIGATKANSADTDDGRLIIHDIYRPKHRYVTSEYQRTAGNVTIDRVLAVLYHAENKPTIQSIVESYQVLNDPALSTT